MMWLLPSPFSDDETRALKVRNLPKITAGVRIWAERIWHQGPYSESMQRRCSALPRIHAQNYSITCSLFQPEIFFFIISSMSSVLLFILYCWIQSHDLRVQGAGIWAPRTLLILFPSSPWTPPPVLGLLSQAHPFFQFMSAALNFIFLMAKNIFRIPLFPSFVILVKLHYLHTDFSKMYHKCNDPAALLHFLFFLFLPLLI